MVIGATAPLGQVGILLERSTAYVQIAQTVLVAQTEPFRTCGDLLPQMIVRATAGLGVGIAIVLIVIRQRKFQSALLNHFVAPRSPAVDGWRFPRSVSRPDMIQPPTDSRIR